MWSSLAAVVLSAAGLASGAAAEEAPLASAKPGDFDYYVLSMSWQPEFCFHKEGRYPQCNHPMSAWNSTFTLHGMWPQYYERRNGHLWPQDCGGYNEKIDRTLLTELQDDLKVYWPNVKAEPNQSSYDSFWDHEWSKHGTCSGLDQREYLTAAMDALKSYRANPTLASAAGHDVRADDIKADYGGESSCALQCRGKFLTDATLCIDKDFKRMDDCPASVLSEDSCGSNVIVASF